MSRLLHRLASRARGVAPEIRPIVGWSAPAGHADAAPRLQDSQRIEPVAAAAASPLPVARAWPTAASHAASGLREAEVAVTPGLRARVGSDDDVRPAPRLERAAAPAAPVDDTHAITARPLEMAFTVAPAPSAFDTERERNATAEDDAPRRGHRAHPEPLLAPPRPASSSPLRPAANAGRAASVPARAAEEVTEVHVTIGRIELTAVHEAPRPRREPARARGPQSLDEYLARREAKRR